VSGFTLYSTLFPCNECTKLIIQTGIKEVVYERFDEDKAKKIEFKSSKYMLNQAGITVK